jgi:hypothetical protein
MVIQLHVSDRIDKLINIYLLKEAMLLFAMLMLVTRSPAPSSISSYLSTRTARVQLPTVPIKQILTSCCARSIQRNSQISNTLFFSGQNNVPLNIYKIPLTCLAGQINTDRPVQTQSMPAPPQSLLAPLVSTDSSPKHSGRRSPLARTKAYGLTPNTSLEVCYICSDMSSRRHNRIVAPLRFGKLASLFRDPFKCLVRSGPNSSL